jgi:hypothetical protein
MSQALWEIQEQLGNLPAQWPNGGTPTSPMKLFMTVAPPTGTYPTSDQTPNPYYCIKMANISYSQTAGDQEILPQIPANPTYEWVANISKSNGYVPPASIIPGWKSGGEWFTDIAGQIIYSGTIVEAVGPSNPFALATPQVQLSGIAGYNVGSNVKVPMTNTTLRPFPANWPVIGMQNMLGDYVIMWYAEFNRTAQLTTNITPGGVGSGNLCTVGPNGISSTGGTAISVVDMYSLGGVSGNFCEVRFDIGAGWVLVNLRACQP